MKTRQAPNQPPKFSITVWSRTKYGPEAGSYLMPSEDLEGVQLEEALAPFERMKTQAPHGIELECNGVIIAAANMPGGANFNKHTVVL